MAPSSTVREDGVLHLIGPDRIGILQEAAAFVHERGGVLIEGISHTLSNEAVVLLYISGTGEQLNLIEHDAPKLGETLQLVCLFTKIKSQNRLRTRHSLPLTLRVSSPDFAGVLAALTRFFTKYELPIVAHHTHRAQVPRSQGSTTYMHKFTVLLPPEFNRKRFLAELDELAQEQNFLRDDISHSDFY